MGFTVNLIQEQSLGSGYCPQQKWCYDTIYIS